MPFLDEADNLFMSTDDDNNATPLLPMPLGARRTAPSSSLLQRLSFASSHPAEDSEAYNASYILDQTNGNF